MAVADRCERPGSSWSQAEAARIHKGREEEYSGNLLRSSGCQASATAKNTAEKLPSQRCATIMSWYAKLEVYLSLTLLCLAVCAGTQDSSSSGTASDTTSAAQGRTLALIQQLGEWWNTLPHPLVVQPLLPAARPHQPWPYRPLSSAARAAVNGTDSYALVATVQHAPLQGEPETMPPAASLPAARAGRWRSPLGHPRLDH